MNKKHFYAVVILLLFLAVGIKPVLAIDIPDDESVGTWDSMNRIYTLTSNVTEGLVITEDSLTLIGVGENGKTITGSGSGTGISLENRKSVTVKNLTVEGFVSGISLGSSSGCTVTNNTVSTCYYGIRLAGSSNNPVTYNTVESSGEAGIFLYNCSGNILTGNTLTGDGSSSLIGIYLEIGNNSNKLMNNIASDNTTGIQIRCSSSNTVTCNTVSSNSWGIRIRAYAGETSIENEVYNNNFFENTQGEQAEVFGTGNITGNVFNLDFPIGGNYWSDWSGPDEVEPFGIVDEPYVIVPPPDVVQDNLPWTVEDGWLIPDTTPPIISCPGNTAIVGPDGVPVYDERIQTFLNGASATDNCGQEPTITYSPLPDIFPPGDTVVTFTATDASGNSSSCFSTVTVVDTESHLRIIPSIINREGRLEKILAVIRFPEGTTEEDIDIGQPLILYPGDSLDGIDAINQRIVTWYRWGTLRVSVFASFSKDEVTADVPDGPVEMMVIGRFDDSADGEYFYGFDNVWIISWDW